MRSMRVPARHRARTTRRTVIGLRSETMPTYQIVYGDDTRHEGGHGLVSTHFSNSARSGPPNDPPKPGAPKPPPRSTHFIWLIGLILTALLLLAPFASTTTKSLAFSNWKTKLDAGNVKSATIDTSGKITGHLRDKSKTSYESRIPTAL